MAIESTPSRNEDECKGDLEPLAAGNAEQAGFVGSLLKIFK
jgi:hypothetical protein